VNLIVVGDLHAREKEPYFSQWKDFITWLFESEHNNSNNHLLLLGDLVESISVQHELLEMYLHTFLHKSKFKKIYILTGNHDRNYESTLLSVFKPLLNVEVIEKETILQIENCKCLFLPHIENKLVERYSNLEYTDTFDYCFHHIEDEDQHFGKSFVDLSYLKINNFLCGHIHTETITKKGHFLGSPTFNSLNEKDKTPYIAIVDCVTKKYELVEVPVWLSYQEVFYPNELPKSNTKYCIYTVYDSIDKEQSIKYYTKQAEEKGLQFYCRRVHSKNVKSENLNHGDDYTIIEKSIIEQFSDYEKINKVHTSVADICLAILKKIEE
jgi:hypothetical protein